MITKNMGWVSITALLLVVSWRPIASYQIPLDFVVCAGSVMGVLALFFIKREVELTVTSIAAGNNVTEQWPETNTRLCLQVLRNFVGEMKMKTMRSVGISLVMILLSAPLVPGQDFPSIETFLWG